MAQIRPAPQLQHKNKPSSKRKRDGELVSGGLIIVRSADAVPISASQPAPSRARSETAPAHPPPNSRLASSTAHAPPRAPSVHPPPAKKMRSSSIPRVAAAGPSSLAASVAVSVPDPQVDEDIARLAGEAQALRTPARSSSAASLHPEFTVRQSPPRPDPAPRVAKPSANPKARQRPARENGVDGGERRGRDDARVGPSATPHRRKSSLSARGKRASTAYDATGVITHPHRAVLAHDFHKHLDREQPEALRLRQLFTWCTSRAAAEPPDKDAPTPLPPLPAGGTEVLLKISEGLMGQLVTGRIDTAVDTSSRALPAGPRPENATNVLNRERERKFRAAVDRAKQEDAAWNQVQAYYLSHQSNVVEGLPLAVQKAKGKGREDLNTSDLPPGFTGPDGLELARRIFASATAPDPVAERLDKLLSYELDRIQHRLHDAAAAASSAEEDISARFASLSMGARPPALGASTPADPRANPDPGGVVRPPNARGLLRAMAARDAARPQAQVPEAVRSVARGLQRAADAGATGLGGPVAAPPGTPRRGAARQSVAAAPRPSIAPAPGTPRRATTPGRTR